MATDSIFSSRRDLGEGDVADAISFQLTKKI